MRPGEPGVAAQTWAQLALLATEHPDIRWLGKQPHGPWERDWSRQYWNDYEAVHGPQAQLGVRTDLRIEGHRNRYGEKALKFGGIDMVLRLLQLIPENVTVGYHGVLDLFKPCTEPKAFLHYWPRTKFFLTPETFDRWLAPRLSVDS